MVPFTWCPGAIDVGIQVGDGEGSMIWRWVIGLFLIAHGLIHASYLTKPPPGKPGEPQWPFHLDRSWFLSSVGLGARAVRLVGAFLVVAVVVGFALAGVGLLLQQGWWRPVGVVSAAASFLQLALYLHPWLVLGLGVDAAIIVALVWVDWPSTETLGV